jgi:hypothetical protein
MGPDGKPQVVEDQAEDVREIFALYLKAGPDRETYETIAKRLNRWGKSTRRGNCWSKQDVGLVLTNPAYTGVSQWGKRRRFKKDNGLSRDVAHIKAQPESDWIDIPFPLSSARRPSGPLRSAVRTTPFSGWVVWRS